MHTKSFYNKCTKGITGMRCKNVHLDFTKIRFTNMFSLLMINCFFFVENCIYANKQCHIRLESFKKMHTTKEEKILLQRSYSLSVKYFTCTKFWIFFNLVIKLLKFYEVRKIKNGLLNYVQRNEKYNRT